MSFATLNRLLGIFQDQSKKRISRNPFAVKLRLEPLEDRRLLSLGDLLYTLDDPSTNPQSNCCFGNTVATDGNLTVVGSFESDVQGYVNAGCAYILNTTTGTLLARLNNPTPASGDNFGSYVAISGNTVVVGARNDDAGATDAGAAYIFDAITGNLLSTLINPTPAAGDQFGNSVSISENIVLVGTPSDDAGATNAGAAYVFDAATGNLLRTLVNPTVTANEYFGESVAISGNIIVVGADGNDTGATNAGAAYIFDAATGNRLRKITNPSPNADDYFGWCVDVSGNTVVIGAYQDGATDAGTAYIFNATTGSLLHTLTNPTPVSYDYFSSNLAVSGNIIIVGALCKDIGANNAGAAYIFDTSTGNLLRTLANPTPAQGDWLGYSVSVSGNIVVVGAPYDDTGATDAGAAYIFDAITGNILHVLTNLTPVTGDFFGSSVAASGNTLVVGAYRDDTGASDTGAAYIFDATTGNLLRTLANPTPAQGDWLGCSVSVSDNMVVVGAPYDDTGATDAGAVYIFDAATGNLLHSLANPTPAASDYFGSSVAISGNTVVVGAYRDDTGASDAGAAYIFDATTGNLLRTLANPTPAQSDWLGYSVSVSGNIVVVGAYLDDTGASNSGAAYIFDATTGSLLHTLANPTPIASDNFGNSVAISGNTVVVGAYRDDTGASDTGAAYIFDATTGNLLRTLANPTPTASDYFGSSLAVSGNTVVVGAYLDDTGASNTGAAYIFDATTGSLLHTLANPTPIASDNFGNSVAISGSVAVVGAYYEDGSTIDSGAAYIFDAYRTYTWDGGSTVDNHWSTAGNWIGDLSPLPGDNLVFPAGAAQLNNVNNYPAGTQFGSVTVAGSGYCFTNGVNSSTNVIVQPAAQIETDKIVTGTLTIGAGAKITITPIAGGTSGMLSTQKTLQLLAMTSISPIIEKTLALTITASKLEQSTSNASTSIPSASTSILTACRQLDQVGGQRKTLSPTIALFNTQLFSAKSEMGISSQIPARIGLGREAYRSEYNLKLAPASVENQHVHSTALRAIVEKTDWNVDLNLVQRTQAANHAKQLQKAIDAVVAVDEELFLLVQ